MPDNTNDDALPEPPPGVPPVSNPVVDRGFPIALRKIGILLGLLLAISGFSVNIFYQQLIAQGNLSLCVGFGIMLAAFGTMATGVIWAFNLAGAGATAIILYIILYNFNPIPPQPPIFDNYARGMIQHSSKASAIVAASHYQFLMGRSQENGDYNFVVFLSDLGHAKNTHINIQMDSEVIIGCIDNNIFKNAIDERRDISLTLQKASGAGNYKLKNNDTGRFIGVVGATECAADPQDQKTNEISFWDNFAIEAFAQSSEVDQVNTALAGIESRDASLRDSARMSISSFKDPGSFKAIADKWDISNSSYRADLGRLVGWSGAITQDRRNAVYITESLKPEQMAYLTQLTGQGDLTLRRLATEVLHRLLETSGWPSPPKDESIQSLVNSVVSSLQHPETHVIKAMDFRADLRRYNTAVALWFAQCNISNVYRITIKSALDELKKSISAVPNSTKTIGKINDTLAEWSSCQ